MQRGGKTNRVAVAREINLQLGQFLHKSRVQSRQPVSHIASSLGISEEALLRIEKIPAEVPVCELGRVIEYYGPQKILDAQVLICEVQTASLRSSRTKLALPWWFQISRSVHAWAFRETKGFAICWTLTDFLKYVLRSLFLSRIN